MIKSYHLPRIDSSSTKQASAVYTRPVHSSGLLGISLQVSESHGIWQGHAGGSPVSIVSCV